MTTHYQTLGVTKTSTQEEIKKSYKSLSKRHHPDVPGGNEAKFKQINTAYEILGDPAKRRQYDLGFSNPNIGRQQANRGNYNGFNRNSAQQFERFFGTRMGTGPRPNMNPYHQQRANPRNRNINHSIKITLEEVYQGVIKKFRIKRHKTRPGTNQVFLEDKLLQVRIPPGVGGGKSLIIKGEGNQYPGEASPGDILLKIIEQNTTSFRRRGQNLLYPMKITLKQALCGFQLSVNHLDGRNLKVPITDVIRPGMEHIIQNEGLPFFNNLSRKGALIIQFEVEFPKTIDDRVRKQLSDIL